MLDELYLSHRLWMEKCSDAWRGASSLFVLNWKSNHNKHTGTSHQLLCRFDANTCPLSRIECENLKCINKEVGEDGLGSGA